MSDESAPSGRPLGFADAAARSQLVVKAAVSGLLVHLGPEARATVVSLLREAAADPAHAVDVSAAIEAFADALELADRSS